MSSSPPIILVTGLTSFVGSHIVLALLEKGYRVRGTVRRDEEVEDQTRRNSHKYPLLEVVKVADLVTNNLATVLQDVSGVVHVASPTVNAGPQAGPEHYSKAVSGTLNVLEQCLGTSVTKIVITSSLSNMLSSFEKLFDWGGARFTSTDWYPAPESLENEINNPQKLYITSKALAEKAVWKFHESHPELDIVVVHSSFVYGPYASDFNTPTLTKLGSNALMYQLSHSTHDMSFPPQILPSYADARDVAKVHVLALENRLDSDVPMPKRRYLMNAGNMIYQDVLELLAEERPDLKPKLVDVRNAPELPIIMPVVDTSNVEEQLGFKDYIPWKQTVLDTFDALEMI